MPLCYPAANRVVYALLGNRKDTLLGEEELLNGAFGGCMCTVGGIPLEAGTIKRRDSALDTVLAHGILFFGAAERTHILVTCP